MTREKTSAPTGKSASSARDRRPATPTSQRAGRCRQQVRLDQRSPGHASRSAAVAPNVSRKPTSRCRAVSRSAAQCRRHGNRIASGAARWSSRRRAQIEPGHKRRTPDHGPEVTTVGIRDEQRERDDRAARPQIRERAEDAERERRENRDVSAGDRDDVIRPRRLQSPRRFHPGSPVRSPMRTAVTMAAERACSATHGSTAPPHVRAHERGGLADHCPVAPRHRPAPALDRAEERRAVERQSRSKSVMPGFR